MTDSTPEPNPSPSPAADADEASPGVDAVDPNPGPQGTWVHRYRPAAPPHRCVLPALRLAHEGDLWRCKCRRLWQVQAYPWLGQVSYRWVRPRLSLRVLFHPLVPDTEWQWALFGVGMVALTAFTAKLGGYLGWWS